MLIAFNLEPEWEFTKMLEDIEAVEREKALFECDVSDPEADVTWFRGEKVSTHTTHTHYVYACFFTIANLKRS